MNEQLIIPILTGLAVIALGGAGLVARWARKEPMRQRLRNLAPERGLTSALPELGSSAGGSRFSGMVANIGSAISSGGASVTLQQHLVQAGYHHPNAASVYLGAKTLALATGLVAAMFTPGNFTLPMKMLFVAMIGVMLFFIPNIAVAGRRERRRSEIRRHLPDAVDLLEICASAGMGLDMAWNSVADEVRAVSTTLADEMALTNLEIHLGAPRAMAMRHMAHRTGAEELSSLVAVLVQSERFGTSISEALRIYAGSMREARSQHAQESAEKMAVKLIFPMVLFIFPAVVMVMAGPGFMMLYKALRAH